MEVFTLIARKKNVALVFVSYLLVALAAISLLTICIGFAPGILFAVVFGLIAYLMIMAQNTEFEYSYFDGELRFAKIKNKSRRKRLGIYSMESVAAIAPAGDRSVYNYENGNELKEIDYTSGQKDVPYYDIVIKSPEENVLIKTSSSQRWRKNTDQRLKEERSNYSSPSKWYILDFVLPTSWAEILFIVIWQRTFTVFTYFCVGVKKTFRIIHGCRLKLVLFTIS